MTGGAVRAAVAGFFADVPELSRVYLDQPTLTQGDTFDLGAQRGSAAVAFVHLAHRQETRASLPSVTGTKAVTYRVGLVVMYQYLQPSAAVDPTVQPDAWIGPLDTVMDAIVAKLRSDPTCGTAGTPVSPAGMILQAGEDAGDIVIQQDLPRQTPGKVISWNVVEFSLIEIVQA